MALTTAEQNVGNADTVVYTAAGTVVQVIIRSRQDGYALFAWYRGSVLNQAAMPVLHAGDIASFSSLMAGDTIHGICPSIIQVDVNAVI